MYGVPNYYLESLSIIHEENSKENHNRVVSLNAIKHGYFSQFFSV